MSAELVLLTPLILLLVLFVVHVGGQAHARIQLESAAGQAARAASLARSGADAALAAADIAEAVSAGDGALCAEADIATDVTAFHPGGVVTVTLTCRRDLGALGRLGGPASGSLVVSAQSPVDRWRGDDGPRL